MLKCYLVFVVVLFFCFFGGDTGNRTWDLIHIRWMLYHWSSLLGPLLSLFRSHGLGLPPSHVYCWYFPQVCLPHREQSYLKFILDHNRAISTSWKCLSVVNPLGSPHTYLSSKTIQGSSVQIQVSDWCMPAFSLEPPTQNRVTFVKPIKKTLGKFLFCFLK